MNWLYTAPAVTGRQAPDFTLPSADGPVSLTEFTGHQPIVLYFMCRFTCSRCWQALMALGYSQQRTEADDTMVLVIGDDRHLHPATQLARELGLPFPLLADPNGAVRRLYGHCSKSIRCTGNVTVYLDEEGTVKCWQRSRSHRTNLAEGRNSEEQCKRD